MNRVKKITKTCDACPSQWEGLTKDDRPIYIRYRWGFFTVQVGDPQQTLKEMFDIEKSYYLMNKLLGGVFDGEMPTERMKDLTKSILDFSEEED